MNETIILEGGAKYDMSEDKTEVLIEDSCKGKGQIHLVEAESQPAEVGGTTELGIPEVDITTSLVTETEEGEDEQMGGHVFWQLLMRAGYTRW